MARSDRLLVSGHSNSAPRGEDLVCAAVSAIVTGAAEIWKNRRGVEIEMGTEDDSPYLHFHFTPNIAEKALKYEYVFVKECLRMISETNPSYVKFIQ